MLDFLLPTYVVAKWSDWDQDYRFRCSFNHHFVSDLKAADKFYFKFMAKLSMAGLVHDDLEVVDYRELGYNHEDAGAGYSSGGFVD